MSIDATSDAWRRQCLAREILRWPLENRRKFLAKWGVNHGAESRQALEQDILDEHARKKAERSANENGSGILP